MFKNGALAFGIKGIGRPDPLCTTGNAAGLFCRGVLPEVLIVKNMYRNKRSSTTPISYESKFRYIKSHLQLL